MNRTAPPPGASFYSQRAISHARLLARTGRGSTTPAERQAAEYVQSQLRSLGITDIQMQVFSGERSQWLFIALVCGLALVGHAAYWLLRTPSSNLVFILMTEIAFGLSAYLIWRRFTWRTYPMQNSLPHAPSQNVIARLPPTGDVQGRLVLLAHLDTHRAVFWFASDVLVRTFIPLAVVTVFGIFAAGPLYILAAISGWQLFAWLGVILAIFHFMGWFTGVTADLGRYSPGANDNASSLGSLLAIAERLADQPLRNTEVWLAFTGCEESDASGINALIEVHGAQLKEAWFIDFEMVGIGDQLAYLRQEGSFSRVTVPPEIEAMLKQAGEQGGLQPIQAPLVGASTECGFLLSRGYKAACLITTQTGSATLPQWHRLTDTPDKLQPEALERVHMFAWDLLQRFDQPGSRS
jgi:hypothetical protein